MLRIIIGMAALLSVMSSATAWSLTGHRVTAAIADRFLGAQARAAVLDILGASEGLAEASTWPDFMRSSEEAFWQEKAARFHFVTVPVGKTYAEVGPPPEGDAVTALKMFADTLKNSAASVDEKRLALRFTIHLVGDLHQPLHAGNGTDRGGNDIALKFFDTDSNLHMVWDEGLIERERLSYTEWTDWLSAKITGDMVRAWSNPDPLVWIGESTAIRDAIYPSTTALSWRYHFDHIATIRQQLQKGGIRLAAYLNWLFAR